LFSYPLESVRFGTYSLAAGDPHCSHAPVFTPAYRYPDTEKTMQFTRSILTLSLLACAAGTALAGGPISEAVEWPTLPQSDSQLTRAEVRAQAQAARDNGTLAVQNNRVYIAPSAPSQLSRSAVQAEAAQALHNGQILSGEASN
jgi:hypothetical protein